MRPGGKFWYKSKHGFSENPTGIISIVYNENFSIGDSQFSSFRSTSGVHYREDEVIFESEFREIKLKELGI